MVDLLKGSRTTNLYSISLNDMMSASPVCLLTKASSTKSWLWHRRLNHLNFGTLNELARKNLNDVVERRNRTLMEAARTMLIFAKAPLFLWAEAVATACYTLNRSLVHTLHGKTYYELLKGKKPNLQYFRVFGSLCYPTNDYDDVGKLKAKADIGIFVGYAPTKKAYRIYNKRTRKIQETIHVTFDELTEGLTSVQTSSGLAPQQMTSVTNSTELELTALQSGRSRSELVKDPEPPSVPPTKKQVDDLFQWFDDDEVIPPPAVPIPPVNDHAAQAPENANGSPSTTVISEGAPAVTESLLPHQIPLPDTSDSDIETLFDHVDSNVFDTYAAPETDSAASPSNTVNIDVTPNNQLPHVQKWTQAHSLENIIGDKDRPVSTRKQLETDAMCWMDMGSLEEQMLVAMLVNQKDLLIQKHPSHVYRSMKSLRDLKQLHVVGPMEQLSRFLSSKDYTKGRGRNPTLLQESRQTYSTGTDICSMITVINIPEASSSNSSNMLRRILKSSLVVTHEHPLTLNGGAASRPDLVFVVCMCATGVLTQGEVPLAQLNFLDIGLLVGHPKRRKVRLSPLQKLNTSPYQDDVLKSSGCALNFETMDLCSTKFRCIVTIKVSVESYCVGVIIPMRLTYFRRLYRESTCKLLPLLGVKQMSPETLKELLDESVSKSKGRTVADSIAERLTRPTAYKFKTDCSIIPVWGASSILLYSLILTRISG
ncbi:retrovirus-related pol polyprotein from transposon TNT 1-94 [Tanacetum coccineum]